MYYHSSYQDSTRNVTSVATISQIHTFVMLFNGIMFTFRENQSTGSLTHSLTLSLFLTHTHTHTQVSYTCFARFEVRTCLVGCYVVLTGNY
jgi:hypothetical protein